MALEENGEMERALEAYQKVLNVESRPIAARLARGRFADTAG